MKASVKAYAKINLFLDMVSRRENGYHNILSVMQSVSLHDVVTVEYTSGDKTEINVTCSTGSIPQDSSNLGYRAANIYPFAKGKIDIHIEKSIPVSAGLAGGSADAAAVLLALNDLCGNPMSIEELKALGATIGADVPFCIECGTCLVEGIGEIMNEFVSMPDYPIVIAKKGEGMSTPAAYKMLDDRYNDFKAYQPHSDMLEGLRNYAPGKIYEYCLGIYNLFEEVVEPLRPEVTVIKDVMNSSGAVKATMSGSGTSVFGIFEDEDCASEALQKLIDLGADAHLCYPCAARA